MSSINMRGIRSGMNYKSRDVKELAIFGTSDEARGSMG